MRFVTATGNPPVFDGHNDSIAHVHLPGRGGGRSFLARSHRGQLDLPRALEGGFGGGLFAIMAPVHGDPMAGITIRENGYTQVLADPVDHEEARAFTLACRERLFAIEAGSDGRFVVVKSSAEIEDCLASGRLAAVLHYEGAEAIDPSLELLGQDRDAGLRSLGIAWSRPNVFGEGVPFAFPEAPHTGPGLTKAGKALVRACNELGILVDLAHLNERGFWDVATISEAPLVVSHSAVWSLCRCTRNLTDGQIDAVAKSGGLVGIAFCPCFLRGDGRPGGDCPLSVVADHFAYVAERVGVEHVAFGSDFDGTELPEAMKDVTGLPLVFDALRERGFHDDELEAMAWRNWLRVLEAAWGKSDETGEDHCGGH